MPECLNFYLDESGSRRPDRRPNEKAPKHDFFAMGGVLINEEEEESTRSLHTEFCEKWNIKAPLHSVEIRHSSKNFSWLHDKSQSEKQDFYRALHQFICKTSVVGLSCVIDRPGYNRRYSEIYGHGRWHLCRTAFAISVERAVRRAKHADRKLRVYVEACGKKEDKSIKEYYDFLKTNGSPFNIKNSEGYSPLSSDDFKSTLYDLKFKRKDSPMMQLADLLLFPMACGGYDKEYIAYDLLRRDKKLIDCLLSELDRPKLGIKYSCFESVS